MTELREPRLASLRHGFGLSHDAAPEGLARPRQVHGARVVAAAACLDARRRAEADAVVSTTPGLAVGVVTADCVPLLLASDDGRGVAAVHAGWRGLARGVVGAAVEALAHEAGAAPRRLLAGIGPHIGACCYEVDGPVLDALAATGEVEEALRPARPGHWMLDLGALALAALVRAGLAAHAVGREAAACTCCDPRRLPSYRRDGPRAGRLVHFIQASSLEG